MAGEGWEGSEALSCRPEIRASGVGVGMLGLGFL